ncbi:Glycerophosphodiester phosphodiesterase GDPD6 [Trichinella spiralis]|uniref:Glycerophosphodiester phosphodiesterase GDPD6 n=2 Tax=Trichinella spiralis TaxID=6334 RepID=A0ABR3KMQ0_TRISP|nr:hypothetical protein T01_250 [Trichinella spiralis]
MACATAGYEALHTSPRRAISAPFQGSRPFTIKHRDDIQSRPAVSSAFLFSVAESFAFRTAVTCPPAIAAR